VATISNTPAGPAFAAAGTYGQADPKVPDGSAEPGIAATVAALANPSDRPSDRSDIPRFYDADSLLAGDSIGLLMKQCVGGLGREIQERMNAHAVTYAQWPALAALSRQQSRTAADLARELQTDAGAMTRMLDRLEEKGLITRTRDQADRRVTQIQLTTEGLEAVSPIREVLAEVLNQALRGFSEEEFERLRGYLRRVHANVGNCKAADDTCGPAEDEPA